MADKGIQVLSTETRTFPPSKEFSEKAHIKSMNWAFRKAIRLPRMIS